MVLQGYTSFRFTHDGNSKTVYRRGSGPGVVIIHEIPGITPPVERFANFVVDAGFTAFLPHLFGTPGKPGFKFCRRPWHGDGPYCLHHARLCYAKAGVAE